MFLECYSFASATALMQTSPSENERQIIGASLSEPHTSGTALRKCVNIRSCLLAAIYRKF